MRVIAGSAGSIPLAAPEGFDTRPTTDKIKETLFNILNFSLAKASFLDLFAGSGGIGIEALSRGADFAAFIEKDPKAVACINANLEHTHLSDRALVMKNDVVRGIDMLESVGRVYSFIFMDPPYDNLLEKEVLIRLSKSSLADSDTTFIIEASDHTDFSYAAELGYEIKRVKEYKNNKHVFVSRI